MPPRTPFGAHLRTALLQRADGSDRMFEQARITSKGLLTLAKALKASLPGRHPGARIPLIGRAAASEPGTAG